ncbi:1-acyl-sn-glycerol-3-phosphate acyltransferase [Aurantiacibacter gilvus]|uniref:1-acyl-sn-glycerol-3-phosphate acyltransferase n=1 Tax=Aurantiacibacter gilvus TaxID=3139141 RepID=A0ABU9IJH0_9SPHN
MSKPTLLSRIVWRLLRWLYRWKGYHLENHPPKLTKFILVGAPHTSNWDFIYFAGAVQEVGIKPGFIGKHSLFKWPLRRFMIDMGGMPINRAAPQGYVKAVIRAIEHADEIALVIAPEGTRSSTGQWKSGFYHIAYGAGIPIVPAWLDVSTGKAGFGEAMMPSGDFLADLGKLAAFYREKMPHCERWDMLEAQARGEVETPGKLRG